MGQSLEELLGRAWDALDDEDYDEAEALGRRALMIDPSSVDARIGVARALINKEDYRGALPLLREAAQIAPKDAEIRTDLGIALFENCEFAESIRTLSSAMQLGADSPDAFYWMGLSLERKGQYAIADEHFARAHKMDPQGYPLPSRITREECVRAVQDARRRLPKEFDELLENVPIRVEDLPEESVLMDFDPPMDPCLLGLFVGVSLAEKGVTSRGATQSPDAVLIFQRNLERSCEDRETLVDEIFTTLYYEIGHYLGFDEDELAETGHG